MIPFPAITICTTQKYIVTESKLDLYQETFAELETNENVFKTLSPEEYVVLFERGNLLNSKWVSQF